MRRVAIVSAAAAIAALTACKSAGKDSTYSCWMGMVCEDYTADIPAHEQDCKARSAEWEKHACPRDGLIGTCVTEQKQARIYYGGGSNAFTSDAASAACERELHGTWTSVK